MRPDLRLPTFSLLLACAGIATAAPAQELTFQNIAWGSPADTVRVRLGSLGYAFRSAGAQGDLYFRRADGAQVLAFMRGGRVVRVSLFDPSTGTAIDGRYRALADSLQAALGDAIDLRSEMRMWDRGRSSVTVHIRRDVSMDDTSTSLVQIAWAGPAWLDELATRGAFSPVSPPFTIVTLFKGTRVSVDTANLQRLAGGTLGARVRLDYAVPREEDGERFDAIEYRMMEADCSAARVRMPVVAIFLAGRELDRDVEDDAPWDSVRADGDTDNNMELAFDAVCRAAGHPVTPVGWRLRTRYFRPVPTGWIVVREDDDGRWLLQERSVVAKGAHVYASTTRVEHGAETSTAYGQTDGYRFDIEVDCATKRQRVVSAVMILGDRDVHPADLPPGRGEWHPGAGSPLAVVVCGIAGEGGL